MDYLPSTRAVTPPRRMMSSTDQDEEKEDQEDDEETFTQPTEGDNAFEMDAISENSNLIDDMISHHPKSSMWVSSLLKAMDRPKQISLLFIQSRQKYVPCFVCCLISWYFSHGLV